MYLYVLHQYRDDQFKTAYKFYADNRTQAKRKARGMIKRMTGKWPIDEINIDKGVVQEFLIPETFLAFILEE